MKMKKLIPTAFSLAAGALPTLAATTAPQKPNIIFILADDLGIGDVSCYGADNRKTPNIDKLAQKGLRFTHAYTAPLCGPSRALIMTGRYAFRTGATNQDRVAAWESTDEVLTAAYLKPAGYATSIIGKWSQFSFDPLLVGFDDNLRFKASGCYWGTADDADADDDQKSKKGSYLLNGKTLPLNKADYMPDVMQAHLFEFITQHRNEPFYVYYSMSHVHGVIVRTPDSPASGGDKESFYVDNCAYMDKLVGGLMDELDRQKLSENTILIFVGDNGTSKGPSERSMIGGRRLIGQKGSMQEGGALVPLIVYWPGVTPKGKVCDDLTDSTDFLPTLAEIVGVQLPKDKVFDGRSLVPQLRGEKGTPRDWIFIQLARMWYVREAGWKLNQAGELYDMSQSPFEEILVPADTVNPVAIAARKRLQIALDQLNPAGGILDDGDGSGRHGNKAAREAKKAAKAARAAKKAAKVAKKNAETSPTQSSMVITNTENK